jgi:hypothetical protein
MAGDAPAVRGSCVQGFPCRYYDRRVLDEHFKGRRREASRKGKRPAKAPQAERTRSKVAGRAVFGSHHHYPKDALRRPPVFPTIQWPDAKAGVAKEKHVPITLTTSRYGFFFQSPAEFHQRFGLSLSSRPFERLPRMLSTRITGS